MSKHYTLITGASKGIGKAIAREAAMRKQNVILAARSQNLLDELATELAATGIEVQTIAIDLLKDSSHTELFNEIEKRGLSVNILINNAGMGNYGKFYKLPLEDHLITMRLNNEVMVRMAYEFIARNKGKEHRCYLLNTASTASYQPVPKMTIYAATKAFMLFFSQGIRFELRRSNISVSALCPGPTESQFFEPAKMDEIWHKNAKYMMTAESVARIALDGTLKRKAVIIPGFFNKLGAVSAKLAPQELATAMSGMLFKG
jgi:short-subunit dehydrogenase